MPVPDEVSALAGPIGRAVQGLIDAVSAARYDPRGDEPGPGLTVGEALEGVDRAAAGWEEAAASLEAVLDQALEDRPDAEDDIRASQSALLLLQLAVVNEIALVQPLESMEPDARLAEVPGWPEEHDADLADIAFGTAYETGLIELLSAGTADDSAWIRGNPVVSDDDVDLAAHEIVRQSSEAAVAVIAGSCAAPLVAGIPLSEPARELVRAAIEQLGELAIEEVIEHAVGVIRRVTRWVRRWLQRARRLLGALIADHDDAAASSRRLIGVWGEAAPHGFASPVTWALWEVCDLDDVKHRAHTALSPMGLGRYPGIYRRLKRLVRSNRRWVNVPVRTLAHGLGLLWPITLASGFPAAPVAAAVLIAWVVLTTGDQLDSKSFPDMWTGLVDRAGGA